ncbi:unnamed protein product [Didymodactylos carnosus]|uniref:Uncharacterized protein n=1 Tax=Didymodactylos carnosus TaxID=1234261 RepID=A0A815GLR5_9BILA|nr:unnamed protein product [Didymodactylos carnosus]CAF4203543.1 unnamed protein product [Didymodactylos carnosus]
MAFSAVIYGLLVSLRQMQVTTEEERLFKECNEYREKVDALQRRIRDLEEANNVMEEKNQRIQTERLEASKLIQQNQALLSEKLERIKSLEDLQQKLLNGAKESQERYERDKAAMTLKHQSVSGPCLYQVYCACLKNRNEKFQEIQDESIRAQRNLTMAVYNRFLDELAQYAPEAQEITQSHGESKKPANDTSGVCTIS